MLHVALLHALDKNVAWVRGVVLLLPTDAPALEMMLGTRWWVRVCSGARAVRQRTNLGAGLYGVEWWRRHAGSCWMYPSDGGDDEATATHSVHMHTSQSSSSASAVSLGMAHMYSLRSDDPGKGVGKQRSIVG